MKKIAVILLSIIIFFFSIFTFVYAQGSTNGAVMTTAAPIATETSNFEYTLPYPGILPDNPLYFLKALRDRIISFLINDQLKKAEFNLLTSDKRLYASRLLLDKNKEELALSTLSKSNNYFEQAINNLNAAKKAGNNIDTVLHNSENALKKREEVISSMREKISKGYLSGLENETKRISEFKNRLSNTASQ